MTIDESNSEIDLLHKTIATLRGRLPKCWNVEWVRPETVPETGKDWENEAFRIVDPQGVSATIVTESVRRPFEARSVPSLQERWKRSLASKENALRGDALMVLSPFLGPSAKERLTAAGISYADATGNLRLAVSRPAVFIETEGETRNPWRENVSLRSLRGRQAAKIVRGLLDHRPPYGIRALAEVIGTGAASVSRVVSLLEREGIATREDPRGPVTGLDWEKLLRRWAVDYRFAETNRIGWYQHTGDLQKLLHSLRDSGITYAVTGSFAACRRAGLRQPRLLSIYVFSRSETADQFGLRRVGTGANVLLARPFDPVAFHRRTPDADGIKYVADSQAAEDLMTVPLRDPAEDEALEALLKWMRSHGKDWRRAVEHSRAGSGKQKAPG